MRVRIALRVLLALGAAAVAAPPLNAAPESSGGGAFPASIASLTSAGRGLRPGRFGGPDSNSTGLANKVIVGQNLAQPKGPLSHASRCRAALPCARTAQGYDEPIFFRRSDPAFH